ncbi:MAG TPA: N(4)-(beta-N-acetylglucosaminyl)-L-asparaginase [Myxococcales bacterium]|nr:N(4)-(beta-N-acetylglucosaminyl)-L-asparaginase [Myxococcales bacterium]
MSLSRRRLLGTAAAAAALSQAARGQKQAPARPVAISSSNGLKSVELAVKQMAGGADPLDAAIAGVNLVEDDPNDMTVGYGGIPNEEGVVQLDSCVMHGPTGRAGAVASLEGVKNPSKVAKLVMETTDHVLLVGPGARHFATLNGFPQESLLTERARKVWLFWKQNLSTNDKWLEPDPERYPPEVKQFIEEFGWDDLRKPQGGGTIHLSALDGRGDLAGCTSTSGLFFKMPGRVGDSPIIGAGCFTDNEVGSAGSTGRGEANILVCGGHLTVELMRQGKHPKDACLMTLERIAGTTREKRLRDANGRPNFHITFYALNKAGQYGCASMYAYSDSRKRRQFAVATSTGARKEDCAFLYERRAG